MIKIAIVEDELSYAKQLEGFLFQYEQEIKETFEITCFSDGDEIVENYRSQFDIILLDVQMKFMDGMTTAEEIRKVDSEVIIIFITNMRQYAICGYAVDALDYVVKPVTYFAFTQRLSRAISKLKKREHPTIMVNIRGGIARVDVSDIYYIESQGHKLIYHTAGGEIESSGTMKDVENNLEKYHFCRGNKGYLINLKHVDGVRDGFAFVRGGENCF